MYQWIQQLNFGNNVETLLAIILGLGSLIAAIALIKWLLSFVIKSDFTTRIIAFFIVAIGFPLIVHLKSDYEIQPLMLIIIVIYSVIWLIKEAYMMFYLNHNEEGG